MQKVLKFDAHNGINAKAHRKEDRLDKQWSLIRLDDGHELATVRTYWPGSTCYACVWIHGGEAHGYANGSAKAGGGGYCKRSASVYWAMRAAGLTFAEHFDGCGEQAIERALESLAQYFGIRSRFVIVRAHG